MLRAEGTQPTRTTRNSGRLYGVIAILASIALCLAALSRFTTLDEVRASPFIDATPQDAANVHVLVMHIRDKRTNQSVRLIHEHPIEEGRVHRTRTEVYAVDNDILQYILWTNQTSGGPPYGVLAMFFPAEDGHVSRPAGCVRGYVHDIFRAAYNESPIWSIDRLAGYQLSAHANVHVMRSAVAPRMTTAFWEYEDVCSSRPSIPFADGTVDCSPDEERPCGDVRSPTYRMNTVEINQLLRAALRFHGHFRESADLITLLAQIQGMQLDLVNSLYYKRSETGDPHFRSVHIQAAVNPRILWGNCSAFGHARLRHACQRLHACHDNTRVSSQPMWIMCSCVSDALATLALPEELRHPRHCKACLGTLPQTTRDANCRCWAKWLLARQALVMQPCTDDVVYTGDTTLGLCGTFQPNRPRRVMLSTCPVQALQSCIIQRGQWRWGGCVHADRCGASTNFSVSTSPCDASWDGHISLSDL